MKLRIRENTLRFRLGRSEVESFDRTGTIGDKVQFGLGKNDFGYLLEKTPRTVGPAPTKSVWLEPFWQANKPNLGY